MKIQNLCLVLCWTITNFMFLTKGVAFAPPPEQTDVHYCGFTEWQPDNRRYGQDVGKSKCWGAAYSAHDLFSSQRPAVSARSGAADER